MKFANTGEFLTSFGTAGSVFYQNTSFWEINDIATDPSGNTWIVDGSSLVLKFDAMGNYISQLRRDDDVNTHMSQATSIAFDSAGNIYVSDGASWWNSGGRHRIQVFDRNGWYLSTIGTAGTAGTGNLQFRAPRHIVIYNNILYVADSANHRIQIIDVSSPTTPAYIGTLGVTGQSGSDHQHFNDPSGVAADMNYIYVADTGNNRVQVFDRATQAYRATIGGSWGAGNHQFKKPSDVAVDASGNIYVADFVNTRVQQFDSGRNYARTYGVTGVPYLTDGYHYNQPEGVAIAPDGSLYVVEESGHRLVKLSATGVPQWTIGVPGLKGDWDFGNDKLNNPADVALDASGRVYVADRYHHRIQIFSTEGAYLGTMPNTQFNGLGGLTIAPDGNLYVADTNYHRVQVFDASWRLIAEIGTRGQAGSDNTRFNYPEDVAVDSRGTIYVSDRGNHRVQVFDHNRSYVRTIGVTGVSGYDFDHLGGPNGLAVDAADRLYVADDWNNRVQVFDADGAYLTTIGGQWGGNRIGQLRGPAGVAVAPNGEVFIADRVNHRIQKFAPGVAGWRQVNINGFGVWENQSVALDVFNGQLYAGVSNTSAGARMWRSPDGRNWSPTSELGFGLGKSVPRINDTIVFNGRLYAGTGWDGNVARIWRSVNGTAWELVADGGFGDTRNDGIGGFAVFNDALYAIVSTRSGTKGFEIWRSSTGDSGGWTRAVSDGFGSVDRNGLASGRVVFNGYLYGGFGDPKNGATIWRTNNGTDWIQVNMPGFGDPKNAELTTGAVFNGHLFFATRNDTTGAQLWRSTSGTTWEQVLTNGFGNSENIKIEALIVWRDVLHAVTSNSVAGNEVWRSSDGLRWEQISRGGFGDSNNRNTLWSDGNAIFKNALYIGTWNTANGGEVWLYLHNRTYLPVVLR